MTYTTWGTCTWFPTSRLVGQVSYGLRVRTAGRICSGANAMLWIVQVQAMTFKDVTITYRHAFVDQSVSVSPKLSGNQPSVSLGSVPGGKAKRTFALYTLNRISHRELANLPFRIWNSKPS